MPFIEKALCVAVFLVSGSHPALAQERPPIVESLELHTTVAPRAVTLGGVVYLAYELHLTNARPDTVSLGRIRVVADEAPTLALADLRDDALARHVQPFSRGGSGGPATSMAPGVRRVFHAWLALPAGTPVPRALRHVIDLSAHGPRGVREMTVTGEALRVSRTSPVALHPPLRGGPWAALYDPLLAGGHRMAIYTIDGRARIPARFAVDWVKLPPSGVFDITSRAPDRNGYGEDVLAVAEGTIAAAVDDMPDNDDTPGSTRARRGVEYGSGNYVVLALGGDRFAFYEHLKSGSIRVRRGQRVRPGDVIAQLGNSGSSSIGPHLHFHLGDANSLLGAEGVPFVLGSFQQLGAFASIDAFVGGVRMVDATGTTRRAVTREMPAPNTVVMFPPQ